MAYLYCQDGRNQLQQVFSPFVSLSFSNASMHCSTVGSMSHPRQRYTTKCRNDLQTSKTILLIESIIANLTHFNQVLNSSYLIFSFKVHFYKFPDFKILIIQNLTNTVFQSNKVSFTLITKLTGKEYGATSWTFLICLEILYFYKSNLSYVQ